MAHILNEDVWHHILQACPQSTLTILSRLSSQFRLLTMPHLFSNVSLNCNPEQTIVFLNFIINNTQRKNGDLHSEITGMGRYVLTFELLAFDTFIEIREDDRRCLVLEKPEPYPIDIWAPTLTEALALMPNLRSFIVHDHTEDIVSHSPDFALALLSRPRLTKIDLRRVGSTASKYLGQAMYLREHATKLQSVKFDFVDVGHGNSQLKLSTGDGLGSVLFHSMKWLEEVSLDSCNLHELLIPHKVLRGRYWESPVIFPNVAAVHLRKCYVYSEELENSFPAMRTLHLDNFVRPLSNSPNNQIYKGSFSNLVSIEGCYEHILDFLQYNACGNLRCLVITYLQDSHYDVGPSRIPTSAPLMYISLSLEENEYNLGLNASYDVLAMITEYDIALSHARNIPTLKYIDVGKAINSVTGTRMWWSIGRKEDSHFDADNYVELIALGEAEGMRLRNWYDQSAFRAED